MVPTVQAMLQLPSLIERPKKIITDTILVVPSYNYSGNGLQNPFLIIKPLHSGQGVEGALLSSFLCLRLSFSCSVEVALICPPTHLLSERMLSRMRCWFLSRLRCCLGARCVRHMNLCQRVRGCFASPIRASLAQCHSPTPFPLRQWEWCPPRHVSSPSGLVRSADHLHPSLARDSRLGPEFARNPQSNLQQ